MSICTKCSILTRVMGSRCDIYISTSESYLLHKIKSILADNERIFKDRNDVISIEDGSFPEIIAFLNNEASMSEAEKEQIQILPLIVGEQISPQHLFSFKTLKVWREMLSSQDLLEVIEHRKITTFFQPIFYTQRTKLFAFECLSRGFANDGRIIPPMELFDKAKILGLHFALDKLTRETAIERAAALGIREHKIFINFLPTAIYNPQDCLQTTTYASEKYGIKPSNLVFEVVESEYVKDIAHLRSILDFYRMKGFKSALDDFGSGYSSLKMLDELRPDYVKIDMHFIKGINISPFKQSVVQAIVSLARNKDILTLAEGIETQKEYEAVKMLGVDLAQGYFLGKPSPKIAEGIFK